ncbi:MAG: A/G-specific adenine glycosylase [Deltaproteobacteria bacterium]|nr:MAG: A/G-specific adenine glycosylase [Deltaproteobacteria bacterium]
MQWYQKHHRKLPWRQTKDPYGIWVSEVMLQQTQVNTVLPYYREFLEHFPDLKSLAAADLQTVLKVWEGLGYYARARNLHRAARVVAEAFDGIIPANWQDFRKLPGVGDYIAAAVLSIAFNQPYAVIDGNVKRVLARLRRIESPVNKSSSYKIFRDAADKLLDPENPATFNQAIMELGAVVCTPNNPKCACCPLQRDCLAYRTSMVEGYPKKLKAAPLPLYHIAVGVVAKNNQVLITQRKPEGLLGGLWEFPGGRIERDEDPETACIREIKEEVNLIVKIDSYVTRVKHAYTHFKIVLDVFCCRYIRGKVKLNGPVDHRWIRLNQIDKFPFPKANHKFIPYLKRCTASHDKKG